MSDPRPDPAFSWLSMHVPYACRHSGACCSSGWPIPLERQRVVAIESAVAQGRIVVPLHWLRTAANAPSDVAGLLATDNGHCVFHQREKGRCSVQSAIGHSALPTSCQHYPRECLLDDRGVFVTLSHYCPTAAGLLAAHRGPVEIVAGPEPVPGAEIEGFDARGAWPPLLRPGVLMDLPSCTAWEAHLVSWLGGVRNADGRWPPEAVVRFLARQARALSAWRHGTCTLRERLDACAAETPTDPTAELDRPAERRLLRIAVAASTQGTQSDTAAGGRVTATDLDSDDPNLWNAIASDWRDHAVVVNRWLAGHAFASWIAYQGTGIVAQVRKLELALAVLRHTVLAALAREGGPLTLSRLIDGVRQADLLLVHQADREAIARALSE